ncbi:hypothetical protein HNQ93_001722 [Hymenobacter luteus]|uniref:YgjP-like metallopeptidase domain-containing protein n=2 Tax=Hymenobacter TaxID=89966 RepID=A0A7W9SZN6_9BACT|nr:MULTISPECIES: SprT family zinc-dependent metalloprotease [Hymenobacter]MBB4600917.1 hypothetical protein [Hymenobacter latericoloratus]MBB6058876.1 hypothetical protein [Hymenobacter luteus]
MPSVQYGPHTIHYRIQEAAHLKAHYLSVDQAEGVVLKGRPLPAAQADTLVLRKARWVLEKLQQVRALPSDDIVTGSRISYLGRSYYTEVRFLSGLPTPQVEFNHSRFLVTLCPNSGEVQPAIQAAIQEFYRRKAQEKIPPRVRKWAAQTGLSYQELKFRRMAKRWGSCTSTNTILLNPDVIRLPFTLIDYVIVHELCHTKVKDHSKSFWAELANHLPNWRELDRAVMDFQ